MRHGRRGSIALAAARGRGGDHAAALFEPWLCGKDKSALDTAEFVAARQGRNRLAPRRYGRLVGRFGAGLPVRLNCPVSSVRTCRDHVLLATSACTLRAGRAILTAPLGVLADQRIRFDPLRPPQVLAALDGPVALCRRGCRRRRLARHRRRGQSERAPRRPGGARRPRQLSSDWHHRVIG
jgi:hypothetical protein